MEPSSRNEPLPDSTLPLSEVALVRYVVIGLVVAIVCAFSGVVQCDFIQLDDRGHVLENPIVRQGLTLIGIKDAFLTPHASLWIPLTWISFMTDVSIFGFNPGAMHAVNLALHTTAAVLLFLALRRMTGRLWECAAVAALFGLHPINVESVAWVTERKNVLCAVFWMLTLLAYARYAERPCVMRYLSVVTAFALALLSKPLAVTLPFALLLLDFWPLQRHLRTRWLRLAMEKVPLFLLAMLGSWIQMRSIEARGAVPLDLVPIAVRISNAATSYVIYLGDLVWPVRLGVFYPHPRKVEVVAAALAALFLGGVTFAAWRERTRRPYLLVGWCWFVGTLVPMIGIVQAGSQARADRFTYIAQIGVFIAIVWLVKSVTRVRLMSFAAAGVLIALAALTVRQVAVWTDSVTLFEHTLSVTRPNARVEGLAATAWAGREDYSRAIPHYQNALRLFPDMAETWNDFGAALTRLDRDPDAAKAFAQALALEPGSTTARYNLASTLERLGHREDAIGQFRIVVADLPKFGRAHYHLGRLLAENGSPDEALAQLQTAARLMPDDADVRGALASLH